MTPLETLAVTLLLAVAALDDARDSSISDASRLLRQGTDVSRKGRSDVGGVSRIAPSRHLDNRGDLHVRVRLTCQRQHTLTGDCLVGITWNILNEPSRGVRLPENSENLRPHESDRKGTGNTVRSNTSLRPTKRTDRNLFPVYIRGNVGDVRIGRGRETSLRGTRDGARKTPTHNAPQKVVTALYLCQLRGVC